MFILIPAIIIFLLLSYSYFNDISTISKGFIYFLCVLIVVASLYLYKKIKQNLKQQEINALEGEIVSLEKKLQIAEDEKEKNRLQRQINSIKDEIQSK
jgi:amino acid permease